LIGLHGVEVPCPTCASQSSAIAVSIMAEVMEDSGHTEDCVRMYRELARNFRHTTLEDYCKNGRWLREHLEVDLELVLAHRRQAGAGEPRPLEEIPIPQLPTPRRLPLPPAPPPPSATKSDEKRLAPGTARPANKSLSHMSASDRYGSLPKPARSRSPRERVLATAGSMRVPPRRWSPERRQNGFSTAEARPRPTTAWSERQARWEEPLPAAPRSRSSFPHQGDSLPPWKGPLRPPPAPSWHQDDSVHQKKQMVTKPGSLIASLLA